jgi:1-acyl-sn-glycerol-3-phosphate acyltransferase
MVAPKGVKDKLGQYWTTLLFACTYFPIAFTCILTLSPFGVLPDFLVKPAATVCNLACALGWNFAFTFSPQIRRKHTGFEHMPNVGKTGRPVFVLSNHVNYVDAPMYLASLPWKISLFSRCYYGAFLEKLFLFKYLAKGCRNIPVFFNAKTGTDFSLDKEKAHITENALTDAIKRGAIISYFPEGSTNKTPRKLLTFRYGSFKKATENNAELWSFIHCGHDDFWKRKQLPGSPATLYGRWDPVAPEGCHKLLESLGKEKDDFKALAEYCEKTCQGLVDELYKLRDAELGEDAPNDKTE